MPVRQVKVEGLNEFRKALKDVDKTLPKQLQKTNKAVAAEVVVPEAKRLAPVRSGRLQGNVRALAGQLRAEVAVGGARVPYAGPIHFGWKARNIAPNPFLYEALDRRREEVIERYSKMIDDVTRKPFPE